MATQNPTVKIISSSTSCSLEKQNNHLGPLSVSYSQVISLTLLKFIGNFNVSFSHSLAHLFNFSWLILPLHVFLPISLHLLLLLLPFISSNLPPPSPVYNCFHFESSEQLVLMWPLCQTQN